MRHLSSVKGSMIKNEQLSELPSVQGPCEVCKNTGHIRYFVAAKLPQPVYLCDEEYSQIRGILEKTLAKVVYEMLE